MRKSRRTRDAGGDKQPLHLLLERWQLPSKAKNTEGLQHHMGKKNNQRYKEPFSVILFRHAGGEFLTNWNVGFLRPSNLEYKSSVCWPKAVSLLVWYPQQYAVTLHNGYLVSTPDSTGFGYLVSLSVLLNTGNFLHYLFSFGFLLFY